MVVEQRPMEIMERLMNPIDKNFWKNKRVFVTGHTGFKGSWLCIWLNRLGAHVTGYALDPPTDPSLFKLADVEKDIRSVIGDIRDSTALTNAIVDAKPEIIFHLAAQPLVRDSYRVPVETYAINVMGTANLLEAIRTSGIGVKAVVNITTDKVYENREWEWGYRENEPLGGYDPYSNSKACSELVTAAFRSSFFNPSDYARHGCAIATARAGNVIGGGDWASDRIVPDCIRYLQEGKQVVVRNPNAIRPWQHVLEPLSGYLVIGEKLWVDGPGYSEGWNFGPTNDDCKAVEFIVKSICSEWGAQASYSCPPMTGPHEATFLKLDCSKAAARLGWYPRWNLEKAIKATVSWYKAYTNGEDLGTVCINQIEEFIN